MRLLGLILVIVTAISCQSGPKTLVVEQCSPFLQYVEVDVVVKEDLGDVVDEELAFMEVTPMQASVRRSMVDPEKSACHCRQYYYGKTKIGPKTGSPVVERPLLYCQNMVGNPPQDYARLTTFLESVRQAISSRTKAAK